MCAISNIKSVGGASAVLLQAAANEEPGINLKGGLLEEGQRPSGDSLPLPLQEREG